MVPTDGSPLVLSGFSVVPNAALGLVSNAGYEFQFRLSDHGVATPHSLAQQWNTLGFCSTFVCADRSSYMVRFPARDPPCNAQQ